MTLREMLTEDLDAVMEIEREVSPDPWTKEGFFSFLLRPEAMFLVVEEKGRILGYCGILIALDEGDITNIAVKKDRQGEGIGGFLLESLFLLTGERGVKTIHLEVREGNKAARSLYLRKGFLEDGIRKNYYTDPTEDAVLMSRSIGAAGQ